MSLQTIIENAPLAEDVKERLLTKLLTDGPTPTVVAEIKDELQTYIDAGFASLGVKLDASDPAIAAAQKTFATDVAAAEAEYNANMENLAIDAAVIQAQANKDIDSAHADAIKASIAA